MKRRSILNKQSVAKRKKKDKSGFPVFNMIRQAVPVFVKGSLFLVLVSGVSLSLMYSYDYLISSSCLRLEHVEVAGVNQGIKREMIEMCSLGSRQCLLFLNMDELKRKMEKHPWVRSVKLDRRFPHTLFVQAEKQSPYAIVLGDGIHYMNQWGEIFKKVDAADETDFPVITGTSKQEQEAREQLLRASRVMGILASQEGTWSLKRLSEVHIQGDEMSLYFSHLAAQINVNCDTLSKKMDGLRKLTDHLTRTGRIHHITGIDLDFVDGAVVSFRTAS